MADNASWRYRPGFPQKVVREPSEVKQLELLNSCWHLIKKIKELESSCSCFMLNVNDSYCNSTIICHDYASWGHLVPCYGLPFSDIESCSQSWMKISKTALKNLNKPQYYKDGCGEREDTLFQSYDGVWYGITVRIICHSQMDWY